MPTSVPIGQVGREIQIEEVAPERRTVQGLGGGAGTDVQDLVRARPVKREFGLEYLGVGVRLQTLAVDLRCGKANTKTPRSFARLDPVFARDNSGRSVLFSIKEESTRLATSSPFSKRHNGKEPPRVKTLLPLPRAPLQNTPTGSTAPASSFNTLTHVFQAAFAPVAQKENPTLRDGPVVTPRPPA